MLLGLSLRNFKAFGNVERHAPMSKITLIYGPNSGGKSSIIQAILMLKQSALEAGSAATIWGLVTRGEYVDLGSHVALLHNHDQDEQLAVGLSYGDAACRLSADMVFQGVTDVDEKGEVYLEDSAMLSEVTYQITKRREVLAKARLENSGGSWWTAHVSAAGVSAVHEVLDFRLDNSFLPELKLLELEILIQRHQEELSESQRGLVRERARLRSVERERAIERVERLEHMSDEELSRLPPLDRDLPQARARMHGLAREPAADLLRALDSRLNLSQMLDLKGIPDSFKETLSGVRYLGPLRSYPERVYRIPGVDSYSSGLRGEFAHHRLYYQPGLVHLVNEWFNRFRIPYELDVRRVGDIALSGEHVTLVLVDRRSKTPVTLPDVGFGINQILPVIVEGVDFFTGRDKGRTLCVEQPEIHLHPRLQAELADLMIANTEGHGEKQWIVETHSELLVLRIQRRIREGKLDPSTVSVLYVDSDPTGEGGSTITPLRLDENGDFMDEWPDGFFEEGFGELMA
ncbi:MAG: DUF3696 domain-containing protein [Gammaproteobacteria bacterium]|nr:DUF3696 domain-containing protein [Gammaproteobacteria bacterium]MDE0246381.1 DUF3696 domain-containing protein [Gammaproteobacteria bacterium]